MYRQQTPIPATLCSPGPESKDGQTILQLGSCEVEEQSRLQSLSCFSFLLAKAGMLFAAQGGSHLQSCRSLKAEKEKELFQGGGWVVLSA